MAANTIGRVPPHNTDAEVALLGSVLLRNRALEEVQSMLSKDDFYQRGHQLIWDAMNGLRNDRPSLTLDLVSLTQYMAEKGTLEECGGPAYIAGLTNSIPASTNATYYASIIRDCSVKRRMIALSVNLGDGAFDESKDIKQVIDTIQQELYNLGSTSSENNYRDVSSLIKEVVDEIHARARGEKNSGLNTGFRSLNSYIGGFKPTEFIIIGARPSVGKTAFALSIAANMAFGPKPVKVGFFSLEMSGASLMERVIANKSRINSMLLRNGKLDPDTDRALMDKAAELYDKAENLVVQDTPNIGLSEIRSQGRRMVNEDGVKIIFIDYIGLINSEMSSATPRHEQIAYISRSLKSLARELRVPIVCLSQVSREAGKDRAPILSDLRESGSIEQDADLVMLLDDASKRMDENGKVAQYDNEDIPDMKSDDPKARPIKVIIAKQRNGSTGAFNLNFLSSFVCFEEFEKEF